MKQLERTVVSVAYKVERRTQHRDPRIVDWWYNTCRRTSRLRGRCFVTYEFDNGAFCHVVIRVVKKGSALRWSHTTDYCSDPTEEDEL